MVMYRSRLNGFTLIEIIIIVAIIGILASIATNNFTRYTKSGYLIEGLEYMTFYIIRMEDAFANNATYADNSGQQCLEPINPGTGSRFAYSCSLLANNSAFKLVMDGTAPETTGYEYHYYSDRDLKQTVKFNGLDLLNTSTYCWLINGSEC